MSTNTGSRLQYKAAAAEAPMVIAGTKTFLFFLKLFTAKEICKAAVQEFTPIEYFDPKYLLHAFSNFKVVGPRDNQAFLKTMTWSLYATKDLVVRQECRKCLIPPRGLPRCAAKRALSLA